MNVPTRDLFGVLRSTGGAVTPARQLSLCLPAGRESSPPIPMPSWIGEVSKAMGTTTDGLHTPARVGARWAAILRRRYPGVGGVKAAARELDRDVRTVEAWFGGQAPYLHHAIEAARCWRDPLVLFDLAGLAPPSDAAIAAEVERMRADLDALDARLARLSEGRR